MLFWYFKVVVKYILLFFIIVSFSKTGFANVCENSSIIPSHTDEDLYTISRWAIGLAYANHAEKAGFVFNNKTYNEDNPHPELSRIGFYAHTSCFKYFDILGECFSKMWELNYFYRMSLGSGIESGESFSEVFFRMARESKMDQYLSPLEGDLLPGDESLAEVQNIEPIVDDSFTETGFLERPEDRR